MCMYQLFQRIGSLKNTSHSNFVIISILLFFSSSIAICNETVHSGIFYLRALWRHVTLGLYLNYSGEASSRACNVYKLYYILIII